MLNKVVVIGRTNVGKSTLFNRLSTNVKSMTLDYEGVTRDFLVDTVQWKDRTFELLDTGGIDFKRGLNVLTEAIRDRAVKMLNEADVLLFVCDGSVGVTIEDKSLATFVHKLHKPTILLVNKSDTKQADVHRYEFDQLGFKSIVEISAQHGTGIADLLDTLISLLPPLKDYHIQEPGYKVALLGKPNVGKSSLMNLLVEKERSLVADVPGTTREAISDKINFYSETIQVTDTAGIRRQRSVEEGIEELMVKSSFAAVRDANVILLLLDGHEGMISQQELKLASYVFEQGKALIIIRNKQDLVDGEIQAAWTFETEPYDYILKKIEILNISCKTGYNVGKVLPLIKEVWERYNMQISAAELTVVLKDALERTPLFKQMQRLKLFSAKQVGKGPCIIRLNVNDPQMYGDSQRAFFENILRKNYKLKSVPVMFAVKKMIFTS